MIDELENNGYRVKLNVIGCIQIDGREVAAIVNVKQFAQKLSIAQMTGCLSKGFFRRLFFAFIEKYTSCPWDKAYGRPSSYKGPLVDGVTLQNTGGQLHTQAQVDSYIATALAKIKD